MGGVDEWGLQGRGSQGQCRAGWSAACAVPYGRDPARPKPAVRPPRCGCSLTCIPPRPEPGPHPTSFTSYQIMNVTLPPTYLVLCRAAVRQVVQAAPHTASNDGAHLQDKATARGRAHTIRAARQTESRDTSAPTKRPLLVTVYHSPPGPTAAPRPSLPAARTHAAAKRAPRRPRLRCPHQPPAPAAEAPARAEWTRPPASGSTWRWARSLWRGRKSDV